MRGCGLLIVLLITACGQTGPLYLPGSDAVYDEDSVYEYEEGYTEVGAE